jgi:predicted TIM-barrel fold metal-dependent hydrolase
MDKPNGFSRRSFFGFMTAAPLAAAFPVNSSSRPAQRPQAEESPNTILLKDYRPHSLYKIPQTQIAKAKFPIIDVHSHDYAKTDAEVAQWVRNMGEVGVEKTVILSGAVGAKFDAIYEKYSKYPNNFEIWCDFDTSGYDQPGYGPAAVRELERCYRKGAKGVGELGDKGKGMDWGKAVGMHPDDPRLDPLFERCAQLGMPINLHVADPIWMYEKMDIHNDGLMNAYNWRLDNQPDIVGHSGMMEILERTVQRHPHTTFIACHLANLSYDLTRLGQLLDRNPNLHADISARYAETATIPRFVAKFYAKYSNRLLYGTDMGFDPRMYRITFRELESLDEHFYEIDQFGYHWSMNGFGLPDSILKRVYRENALEIFHSRKATAI